MRAKPYRPRYGTRARTVRVDRVRVTLLRSDRAETADYLQPIPRTWGECQERALGTATNPCAHLRCRYNLLIDVDPHTGSYKITWPDLAEGAYTDEYRALPEHTCALREAERGGMALDEVGAMMNVTRERVRQIETNGLVKLRRLSALVRAVDDDLDYVCQTSDRFGAQYGAW